VRRAVRLYAIDMGRGQKLVSTAGRAAGKTREVDEPKAHGNRLEAVNATAERKRARGGEISRESIAAHALDTFGSPEKARHWMNRPNPLFQGKTAAQVVQFDLVGVEAELVRIGHGVYM